MNRLFFLLVNKILRLVPRHLLYKGGLSPIPLQKGVAQKWSLRNFSSRGIIIENASASNGHTSHARLFSTFFLFSFFLFSSSEGMAQHKKVDWPLLAKVKWDEKYFKEYDETVFYPDFSKEVSALDSTLIEIKGYVIPVDVESGYYVLSANPYASCFFCGNAGPESVMELQFPKSMKSVFKMDEIITFKGRLKLNWDDLEHCNYILKNATPK